MFWIWMIIIIISIMGIFLGMFYFLMPETVVLRRMRKMSVPIEDKDPNFQKWLRKEFDVQVARTKKIGKVLAIFESIWLLIILMVFFSTLRS